MQIDLDVLARLGRDLGLRTPGATGAFLPQPATYNTHTPTRECIYLALTLSWLLAIYVALMAAAAAATDVRARLPGLIYGRLRSRGGLFCDDFFFLI